MSIDLIIQAARCPRKDGPGEYLGVFAIGPFARRVSFAYQQRRALDLVWALNKQSDTGWDGRCVAVVGGSLSGLMAAAAFGALGARVHLFERGDKPLHLFGKAGHRKVHPTINQWPEADFECTTALPFMNWCEDTTPRVAEQVRDEWLRVHDIDRMNVRPYMPYDVRDIDTQNDGDKERYTLRVRELDNVTGKPKLDETGNPIERSFPPPGPEDGPRVLYDIVVFATGFGSERDLDASQADGYWEPDKIDLARKESDYRTLLVSGAGDGALADVCRFFFDTQSKAYSELLWKLSRLNGLSSYIKVAEAKAFEKIASSYHGFQRDDAQYEAAFKEACASLSQAYAYTAEHIVTPALREHVYNLASLSNKVVMVGCESAPFSPFSAPMLKLLLALLMHHSGSDPLVTYRRVSRNSEILHPDGESRRRPIVRDSSLDVEVEGDMIVVRHGPKLEALTELLKDESLTETIKNKQRALSNVTGVGECDPWYFAHRLGRPTPDHKPEFYARENLRRAKRRLEDGFQLDGSKASVIKDKSGKIVYATTQQRPERQPYPDRLFGVSVEYGCEQNYAPVKSPFNGPVTDVSEDRTSDNGG